MRPDLDYEPDGKSHFRVVWKESREPFRTARGQIVSLPSSPSRSGHAFANMKADLQRAGVLVEKNGQTRTKGEADAQLRLERMWSSREGQERVQATKELRGRFEPILAKAGGMDKVKPGDMARIAAKVHGNWELESAMSTVSYFLAGRALSPNEIERLTPLVEHLEGVPDARQEWFALLREVMGLEAEVKPGRAWPFTVKTLLLDHLFADFDYQRPVQENFVRDMVLRFDERLVGVLNVSDRGNNSFAIIDGLQRKTAMERLGKTAAYCCIHEGLGVEDEAALFYHHNRDRKPVHPYYDFRARMVAGDPVAKEIHRIVEEQGFVMSVGAQGKRPGERERNISGIRSLEEVYGYFTEVRDDALTPTLSVIFRVWLGRPRATDASLIRGLGMFFRTFGDDEIEWERWERKLGDMGPQLVLGRAADMSRRETASTMVATVLVDVHNEVAPRSRRLDSRAVQTRRKPSS